MIETLLNIVFILLLIFAIYIKINKIDFFQKSEAESFDKKISNEEYISSNIKDTELYPVNMKNKYAWTDKNISQYPIYHTSKINSEKTNIGAFFDRNQEFVDIISPRSKTNLPDRCILKDNNIFCNFNDRINNIPPRFIEEPKKNSVLRSIGDDKNTFDKGIINDLKEEKVSNGGEYYNGVFGYSTFKDKNLQVIGLNSEYLKEYSL